MRHLTKDADVNYVAAPATDGGKPTIKKAKIVEVISPGAARIEFSENNHALASHSSEGEIGTFHFPEETKDVKKSESFGDKPAAAGSNQKSETSNQK